MRKEVILSKSELKMKEVNKQTEIPLRAVDKL